MHDKNAVPETHVAVLGLGYVGCVTAACLANLGHRVTGIDTDEFKVESVRKANAPFYEPGLEDLIRSNVAAGRLAATTSIAEGLAEADIALICVGTPSERNGNLGLEPLRRVCTQIAQLLPGRSKPLIVVVRSTVFPGTCEEVVMPALGSSEKLAVVANPEFLREGSAVRDFMEPSLVVVGGTDQAAVKKVAALYDGLGFDACLVTLRTAEMIKYACNCFHAVKISFANEIGALSARLGVPSEEVMDTVCRDVKLNVSPAYLKPGFAFGGSCLPKDLRALVYRAGHLNIRLPMLENVLASNDEHLRRAMHQVMEMPGKIGIFGLAFKENTDDLRESPTVPLIEYLIGKGRDLRLFDPHIQLDQIYGSNKSFLFTSIPHIGRLLENSLDSVLEWADAIVIAQKPGDAFKEKLAGSGKPLLNLTGAPQASKERAAVS